MPHAESSCTACTEPDSDEMVACDGPHDREVWVHYACCDFDPSKVTPDEPVYCPGCRAVVAKYWDVFRYFAGAWSKGFAPPSPPSSSPAPSAKRKRSAVPDPAGGSGGDVPKGAPLAKKAKRAASPGSSAATEDSDTDGADDGDDHTDDDHSATASPSSSESASDAGAAQRRRAASEKRARSASAAPSNPQAWTRGEEDLVAQCMKLLVDAGLHFGEEERYRVISSAMRDRGFARQWSSIKNKWTRCLRAMYRVEERRNSGSRQWATSNRSNVRTCSEARSVPHTAGTLFLNVGARKICCCRAAQTSPEGAQGSTGESEGSGSGEEEEEEEHHNHERDEEEDGTEGEEDGDDEAVLGEEEEEVEDAAPPVIAAESDAGSSTDTEDSLSDVFGQSEGVFERQDHQAEGIERCYPDEQAAVDEHRQAECDAATLFGLDAPSLSPDDGLRWALAADPFQEAGEGGGGGDMSWLEAALADE